MSERQYEVSQAAALEHYPQQGVPTPATLTPPAYAGPTCTIYGPGAEVLATPSVTIDSASQTVNATRGQRALTGTSTGYTVGRRYWLATAGGGFGFAARVADLGTGIITLATTARLDITNGTLKGLRLSASYTPTVINRACRVVWRYRVAGVEFVETELVDFVPFPFSLGLTQQLLEELSGTFGDEVGGSGSWAGLIDRATDEAFAWLAASNIRPERVIDRQGLTMAYGLRVLALRHMAGDADRFDRYQAQFTEALATWSAGRPWYDEADDLAVNPDAEEGPPSREMRIG